jgi:predicted RNA-binding protein with PIN domain
MATRLAIDGYNLIGASAAGGLDSQDIEEARAELIRKLSIYKRIKRLKVQVVFDGTYSGRLSRSKETQAGVSVVYSRSGEEADDILREISREGSGVTIVTSDRAIISYAEAQGAVVIGSAEFMDLLEMAEYAELKGLDGPEDEYDTPEKSKKGPSRRANKKDRKKKQRLKKL